MRGRKAMIGGFWGVCASGAGLSRNTAALVSVLLILAALLTAAYSLLASGNVAHTQSTVPAAPTGLTATSVSHDSVTLSWVDPGDGSITGYQVLRRDIANQASGTFTTIANNTGSGATTYTDNAVSAETRYVYRVKAINAEGTSGQSNYVNVHTPAAPAVTTVPATPAGLTASSVSQDSVTLTWDDPGNDSITGYQVLRRSRDGDLYEDGQGAAVFVAIVDDTGSPETAYRDTSVAARTRYVYRVKAINPEGMSERSSYLNIETSEAPATPPPATEPTATPVPTPSVPAAPTGLAVSSATHDSVTLTWDNPGDSTVESYQVLKRSRDGDEYGDGLGAPGFVVIVDDTGSSAATYTDGSVEAGTRYAFAVKARNSQGLSEVSSAAEAETLDAPADTPLSLAQGSRPNVVLILADDFGWGDIETNNPDSAMTSANIDGIASAGANFIDAHSPSSMCSPTRYGLLTGRYSWRTWLTEGVLGGSSRPMIGPGLPTLGTLLRGHGYRTAAVGKWHLGMDFANLSDIGQVNSTNRGIDFDADIVDGPLDHGFDEFFGTSANLRWEPHIYIRDRRFLADPERGQSASGTYNYRDVLDRLTDEAVSFVERSAETGDPFFLYLPLHTVHVPLAPNAQFSGLTGLGPYADVVAQMDWTVGQVLDALERAGVRDDTLVIFSSDNGSYMDGISVPNHIGTKHMSNGHWRGGKGHISEGGHRVPFLMQWPRGIEAGSTVAATVSLTDMYATLAGIVGEEPDPGVAPDSVSLLPLLHGQAETRGAPVVHHSRNGMFALRDGRWKLVFGDGHGGAGRRTGGPFGRPWQLFDLEQDPREDRNVAGENPEVMARMEAALEQILAAEDGTLPSDVTLKSLNLAGVDIGGFDPGVLNYNVAVARGIEFVPVTAIPTATDADVVISYDRRSRAHGRVSIPLDGARASIRIRVTAPDKSATATYKVTIERSGAPAITGTPRVGETLTVDTGRIADSDGMTAPAFSYQWVRNDGSGNSDIFGATAATYTLTTEDLGRTIRVRVTFTDDGGNAETRTSLATDTVGHAAVELTAAQESDTFPVMSGYSSYGDLGMLSPDGWQIDGTTYKVRYLVHSSEGLWLGMYRELPADFTLFVGNSVYLGSESMVPPSIDDMEQYWWPSAAPDWSTGKPVQVRLAIHRGVPLGERSRAPVTGYFLNHLPEHDGREDFSFRIYFSEGVATTAVALRDHVLSVSGGVVSGVEAIGNEGWIWEVSITPDFLNTVTVEVEPDLECALPGAVCTADGRRLFNRLELRVPMRPNNPPTGAPTISGTVEVGETLAAETSGIADGDGLTGATFSYQWVSYDGNADTDIQGATNSTYTLVPADEGRAFRVRVSFTDGVGYEESLTSALFGSDVPYGLNASVTDGAVFLTWKPPVGLPNMFDYQILRNRPELGEPEPLVFVEYTYTEETAYTDTDVEPGVLYVYRVKAADIFGRLGEASEPVEIRTT